MKQCIDNDIIKNDYTNTKGGLQVKKNLDDQIQVRISPEMKEKGGQILKSLGLEHASFVRMAYTQLVKKNKLPFSKANFDEGALTELLLVRVDSEIKNKGLMILEELGINNADFVRMAYYHLIRLKKLPFKNVAI